MLPIKMGSKHLRAQAVVISLPALPRRTVNYIYNTLVRLTRPTHRARGSNQFRVKIENTIKVQSNTGMRSGLRSVFHYANQRIYYARTFGGITIDSLIRLRKVC